MIYTCQTPKSGPWGTRGGLVGHKSLCTRYDRVYTIKGIEPRLGDGSMLYAYPLSWLIMTRLGLH